VMVAGLKVLGTRSWEAAPSALSQAINCRHAEVRRLYWLDYGRTDVAPSL